MATRTSTRSTKAVKFVDSADEDEVEFNNSEPPRIKDEPKKVKARGRPRRNQSNDDEEWDARNEQIDEAADDDDDISEENEDVTKKFKTNTVNRSIDSVYDFG
jgi:hypothetical protein